MAESDLIDKRINELKAQRQAASVRAGQLQEELNRKVIEVHQLDGAIAALESLIAETVKD